MMTMTIAGGNWMSRVILHEDEYEGVDRKVAATCTSIDGE
jgi:hypothetical protein